MVQNNNNKTDMICMICMIIIMFDIYQDVHCTLLHNEAILIINLMMLQVLRLGSKTYNLMTNLALFTTNPRIKLIKIVWN